MDLFYCKSIETLPTTLGDLKHFIELKLQQCENLKELPFQSIGRISSLSILDLSYCKSIKSLPTTLGDLNTIINYVICNHYVCNWDAAACRMQLSLVFYATTMNFCPLFWCVCNYGATMITFISTFGWFLWYIIVYIWYAYTHSCMCNQNRPTIVFW